MEKGKVKQKHDKHTGNSSTWQSGVIWEVGLLHPVPSAMPRVSRNSGSGSVSWVMAVTVSRSLRPWSTVGVDILLRLEYLGQIDGHETARLPTTVYAIQKTLTYCLHSLSITRHHVGSRKKNRLQSALFAAIDSGNCRRRNFRRSAVPSRLECAK